MKLQLILLLIVLSTILFALILLLQSNTQIVDESSYSVLDSVIKYETEFAVDISSVFENIIHPTQSHKVESPLVVDNGEVSDNKPLSLNEIKPLEIDNKITTSTLRASATSVPTLHVVTYASHGGRDDRFCRAMESAFHHNVDLVILGWEVPWTGLAQKLYAAYHYAKSLPPSDIVLFVDAYDIMFSNTPSAILEAFLADSMNILVFGAECGCWPQIMENRGHDCFHAYAKSPTNYRYLNSGTWIGRASAAASMLNDVMIKAGSDFENANDQKLVSDMYIHHQHNITLDYYSKIFQSMHRTDAPLAHCNPSLDIILQDTVESADGSAIPKSYFNKHTNTYPSVFHFNGGGKEYHLRYERDMWYRKKQRSELKENKNRREVFEKLGNFKFEIIPKMEDHHSQTQKTIVFSDLCRSYWNNLIHDVNSV